MPESVRDKYLEMCVEIVKSSKALEAEIRDFLGEFPWAKLDVSCCIERDNNGCAIDAEVDVNISARTLAILEAEFSKGP